MHTFTAGDDPQSNCHCEAQVNQLKRRTRLLLHMAGQDNTHWPQAMRFATEERLRQQMELLGSPVQKMLPYKSLPGESAQVTEKTAISPTASLCTSWGQILDWWKGHEGLLCEHCWWVGLPCPDRWGDPVVEAEAQWSGYTFLTMKREVMDQMNLNIQLQPATTADRPPWPMSENPRDDDLDVHLGRHYEMEKPCRHRPQQELGLMVGRLYLDGCLASSGSGTVSTAGSAELRLVPLMEPTSQHNKTSGAPTVGFNRGGVIQRGIAATSSTSSSSSGPQMPKSFGPLVKEWALVTDDEKVRGDLHVGWALLRAGLQGHVFMAELLEFHSKLRVGVWLHMHFTSCCVFF